ncbi:hypothetical protein [Echinicola vietnamensis]|uniref:Uncharacterized protein n=1 Tax=Echinicola vietnamensis (strain DSM 17526 / LMG 23754 / KMM 6221) TaxID=926556 RepID=L0FX66_ECHVK|nr:hypothetical protein [Echinicola vietnamensis]AGA77902.1 hypothetical protein Echvi_1637 [Echinicola vietnamensis DSM 17526]
MNTKFIMTASAIFMFGLGIGFTFLPNELALHIGAGQSPVSIISLQLLGALYIAFGAMNWMQKNGLIGGIYNRPLILGNFGHFMIGGMALIKFLFSDYPKGPVVWGVAVIYLIFAVFFGRLMFKSPVLEDEAK